MTKRLIAMSLSAIGIIFIFAVVFDIIANNVGYFLALSFLLLSGIAWAVLPDKKRE